MDLVTHAGSWPVHDYMKIRTCDVLVQVYKIPHHWGRFIDVSCCIVVSCSLLPVG